MADGPSAIGAAGSEKSCNKTRLANKSGAVVTGSHIAGVHRLDAQPPMPMDIRERDIAVLFRKRNYGRTGSDVEVVRALEAGVAHLLAGSKSFHRREEVEYMLRVALTAIEWPDNLTS